MANNASQPVPNWMIQKAKARLAYVKKEMEQAKVRIDKKYHDFLVYLPQSEKLGQGQFSIAGEAAQVGIYCYNGNVYLNIEKPYLTVDGRVQMLRDQHEAVNAKFSVHPPHIYTMADKMLMSVQIDSDLYGSATGLIEVNVGGKAVDASNPFANAQTSAIGRALGFLGYGLVGTGVIEDEYGLDDSLQNEPQSAPTPNQTKKSGNNRPVPFRLLLLGQVTINPDGSATASAKLETQEIINLVLPKGQVAFSQSLQPKDVIHVTGWLQEEKARLVVAENSNSSVEPKQANA